MIYEAVLLWPCEYFDSIAALGEGLNPLHLGSCDVGILVTDISTEESNSWQERGNAYLLFASTALVVATGNLPERLDTGVPLHAANLAAVALNILTSSEKRFLWGEGVLEAIGRDGSGQMG